MTYAWVQDVPITAEIYDQIKAQIMEKTNGLPPIGSISHIVQKLPNGLRYLDVWESKEACDRFTDEILHPIVGRALKAAGVNPQGEPPRNEIDVHDVWNP